MTPEKFQDVGVGDVLFDVNVEDGLRVRAWTVAEKRGSRLTLVGEDGRRKYVYQGDVAVLSLSRCRVSAVELALEHAKFEVEIVMPDSATVFEPSLQAVSDAAYAQLEGLRLLLEKEIDIERERLDAKEVRKAEADYQEARTWIGGGYR